jgi:hypothetical protein
VSWFSPAAGNAGRWAVHLMIKYMKPKIFIIFMLLLITVGCEQVATKASLQKTATIATSTFTPVSTKTPLSTTILATATPTDNSSRLSLPDFRNLGPGQYILFKTYEKGVDYLILLSPDKTILRKFELDKEVGVSNDGKQLMIIQSGTEPSYILDVTIGKWAKINLDRTCFNPSWSVDKIHIAVACFVNNYSLEIFILDTTSNSLVQITHCLEKENSCIYPAWSFDGQHLAYYRSDERSGEHPKGICILDSTRVESDACVSEDISPINSDTNAVWSLDGNLILAHDGEIKFFKSGEPEFQEIKSLDSGMDYLDYLQSSPDGKYLIFTGSDNQLYIYTLPTGASEEIFDSHESIRIVGWIVIE